MTSCGSCHWTYRLGQYRSPWYWPTRQDAERAADCLPAPANPTAPEVYQVHADGCTCQREEVSA